MAPATFSRRTTNSKAQDRGALPAGSQAQDRGASPAGSKAQDRGALPAGSKAQDRGSSPAGTCPEEITQCLRWLYRGQPSVKYTWSYEGKLLLADQEWHQVQLGGNHVLPADESHVNAHWAQEIRGFHGTSPNALAEILKFGGLNEGKVHDSSHAPFAVLLREDAEATAGSTYAKGAFVETLVHGNCHAYNIVGKTATGGCG